MFWNMQTNNNTKDTLLIFSGMITILIERCFMSVLKSVNPLGTEKFQNAVFLAIKSKFSP